MLRRTVKQTNAYRRDAGFTLIELMVAVVIVVILTTVAVIAYIKHIRKGRIVEAKTLVATMQARQETYFQQFGQYCDASNTGMHPTPVNNLPKQWNPSSSSGWRQLGVRPQSGYTYFTFDMRASNPTASHRRFGEATVTNMQISAQPTGTNATPHPWYYVTAEADLDGSGAPNTELRASSSRSTIIVYNEGD